MNSFTSSIIVGFIEVGGYEAMIQKYFASFPDTTINNMGNSSYKYAKCGIPPDNAMHLFRSAEDGSLPWPGIMFGLTISAVWYWCSDQVSYMLKRTVKISTENGLTKLVLNQH